MKAKFGLKARISIALVALILVVIILTGGMALSRGIKLTEALMGEQVFKAAAKASETVDVNKLAAVIKDMDSSSEAYRDIREKMNAMRSSLDLKYLYIMMKNNKGQYIYLVDGMTADEGDFSKLGDVEDNKVYYAGFDKAMQGNIVKGKFDFSPKWGSVVSTYIPIRDNSGKVIAFLGADMDATESMNIMKSNTLFMVIFMSGIFIVCLAAMFHLSSIISSPITKLSEYSAKIAKGETVSPIKVKGSHELGDLAAVLNDRAAAIKNLLNNMGQGLLSFGEDLLVDTEYSLECRKIFNRNIENMKFPELIYPDDIEQQNFIGSIFAKILREKDESKRNVYLPLLSDEIAINGRNINVDYKIIDSNGKDSGEEFMVILTDVTDKRVLENHIVQERDTLKMVVKTVINYNDFAECLRDFQNFTQSGLGSILESGSSNEDKLLEIMRIIHTFKGNFGQLDMNNTSAKLHEFEDWLIENKGSLKTLDSRSFGTAFSYFDIASWVEKDMDILRGILGDKFLMKYMNMESVLMIDKVKLKEIEEKMLSILSPFDCRLLLPEIEKLRYKPFKELLRTYPEYVSRMAGRLGKQVKLMEITGGDFLVDTDKYIGFTKSLTHVFRNALDHGLEPVDERMFRNKEEYGRIRCIVKLINNHIHIMISDNGRGMDMKKIRNKAVEKGIISEEKALQLSYDEILNLVFTDELSTKETADEISGRGVGLPAVKREIDKLNGSVVIKSKSGEGTEFHFILPFNQVQSLDRITINDIMNPLLNTAAKFIAEQLGEQTAAFSNHVITRMDRLNLSSVTAFMDIKGIFEGRFAMSFDEKLAEEFTEKFAVGGLPKNQVGSFIEDSIAECLNIILGNSLKMMPGLEELLIFSSPVTISSDNTSIKYKGADIWTCNVAFDTGNLSISFVTTEKGLSAA